MVTKSLVKKALVNNYRVQKPTIRQRVAVERIVENGGNVSKSMREAGYSKETAKTPQKLVNSKGFREIANEIGLTDKYILEKLGEDIEAKPRQRLGELALAAKIKGMLRDNETVQNVNILVLPQGLIQKNEG